MHRALGIPVHATLIVAVEADEGRAQRIGIPLLDHAQVGEGHASDRLITEVGGRTDGGGFLQQLQARKTPADALAPAPGLSLRQV